MTPQSTSPTGGKETNGTGNAWANSCFLREEGHVLVRVQRDEFDHLDVPQNLKATLAEMTSGCLRLWKSGMGLPPKSFVPVELPDKMAASLHAMVVKEAKEGVRWLAEADATWMRILRFVGECGMAKDEYEPPIVDMGEMWSFARSLILTSCLPAAMNTEEIEKRARIVEAADNDHLYEEGMQCLRRYFPNPNFWAAGGRKRQRILRRHRELITSIPRVAYLCALAESLAHLTNIGCDDLRRDLKLLVAVNSPEILRDCLVGTGATGEHQLVEWRPVGDIGPLARVDGAYTWTCWLECTTPTSGSWPMQYIGRATTQPLDPAGQIATAQALTFVRYPGYKPKAVVEFCTCSIRPWIGDEATVLLQALRDNGHISYNAAIEHLVRDGAAHVHQTRNAVAELQLPPVERRAFLIDLIELGDWEVVGAVDKSNEWRITHPEAIVMDKEYQSAVLHQYERHRVRKAMKILWQVCIKTTGTIILDTLSNSHFKRWGQQNLFLRWRAACFMCRMDAKRRKSQRAWRKLTRRFTLKNTARGACLALTVAALAVRTTEFGCQTEVEMCSSACQVSVVTRTSACQMSVDTAVGCTQTDYDPHWQRLGAAILQCRPHQTLSLVSVLYRAAMWKGGSRTVSAQLVQARTEYTNLASYHANCVADYNKLADYCNRLTGHCGNLQTWAHGVVAASAPKLNST